MLCLNRGCIALLIALVCTLGFVVVGCGGAPPAPGTETPRVVATTSLVADLVRQIGGDDVEVVSLMGPGVDPHLYKPTAGDVGRLTGADAVFFNGLHLEGKMAELLADVGARGVPTVAIAECVEAARLISDPEFADVHDPHVWFDVDLWSTATQCTAEALSGIDPEHRTGYEARAAAFRTELADLDAWVRERLAAVPETQRVLVTAHDAFAYFGRAYGFEVRALLGISTAAEAGAADVKQLADFIEERRIPAIFVETSVSPRFVQAVQEAVAARGFDVAIGGELFSDALGSPDSPAATYVGTVRANVETIVAALLAGGGP